MSRRILDFLCVASFALIVAGCGPAPKSAERTPSGAEQPLATEQTEPPPTTPAPTPEPAPAGPQSIRIVAWNIEWFPGRKPDPTPEAEAQQMESAKIALANLKPDVLLVEEVRDWESVQALCSAVPGLQVHVTSRFEPRTQNQAVASRFVADSAWSETWQSGATNPPRGYSFAAIELPDRRLLLTYALHFKSNRGEFAENALMRQTSAKQLLRHAQEMVALYGQRSPCAVVIGGDFNTSFDDPRFAEEQTLPALRKAGLHWVFTDIPLSERITIPGRGNFPDNCFDHIFTAGLGRPIASVGSHPETSDHNPVVLDVDLSKADFKAKLSADAGIRLLDETKIVATPATAPETVAEPIQANDAPAITTAVGKLVKIKGRVSRVGSNPSNSIHFVNFADVPKGGFVGIVRRDHYSAVAAAVGGDLGSLMGRNVEVSGKITMFKDTPQIEIATPEQIKVAE